MADLNVLVDTNVAIDWLNNRQPWANEATLLWESRDAGKIAVYLPASVLTDIFYILRKPLGNEGAKHAVERCVSVFGLLPVDGTVIRRALDLSGADFEDNVQIACSQIYQIDLIVTRNPGDFTQGALIPIVDPKDISTHLAPSATT